MSHQQSTRCITTLLIIHHLRNRVTIQQTVTILPQIVIIFHKSLYASRRYQTCQKIDQTVKTLLTLYKTFNVLENHYNDSRNRYNDFLEYVDLIENSQSVANVL
jgi:predicted MPP superfamily phosphohydrolase